MIFSLDVKIWGYYIVNKRKTYLLFVVGLGLVFLFNAKEIFSQDSGNIQPFRSIFKVRQSSEDKLIKQWANHYKNSHGINQLYVYKAMILDLPSACKASGNNEKCLAGRKELLERHNWAIGRCKGLDGDDGEICMAIRKNDCSSLVDEAERKQCEGYLDLDPELLKEGLRIDGNKTKIEYVLRDLAYYSVFKNNNALACIQLLKNDAYFHKVGCSILASSDPQSIIDKYALDFAYYNYSNINNKKSACSNINDEYIRRHCEKGTNFSHFVDKYFLGN